MTHTSTTLSYTHAFSLYVYHHHSPVLYFIINADYTAWDYSFTNIYYDLLFMDMELGDSLKTSLKENNFRRCFDQML